METVKPSLLNSSQTLQSFKNKQQNDAVKIKAKTITAPIKKVTLLEQRPLMIRISLEQVTSLIHLKFL